MNYVIKLVAQYQLTESEHIFELIIMELKDLIDYHSRKIVKFHKEDLHQELIFRVFKVIKKFKFIPVGNIDKTLFNQNILNDLEKNEFKNINLVFQNKHFSGFIEKYGCGLFRDACLNNKIDEFLKEFEFFSNENQFYDYLNISLYREKIYYYRKHHIKENINSISLNSLVGDGIEMIDTISDYESRDIESSNKGNLLSEEDRIFISNFYDGKMVLSGKEVAKKLGVSQQAISGKLKRVRRRYFKKLREFYIKVEK